MECKIPCQVLAVLHRLTICSQAWYSSAIICCAEISAAAVVIEYWKGAEHINVGS